MDSKSSAFQWHVVLPNIMKKLVLQVSDVVKINEVCVQFLLLHLIESTIHFHSVDMIRHKIQL